MRNLLKLLVLCCMVAVGCRNGKSSDAEMDRFIDSLMSRMTIEEKIGQTNLVPPDGSIMTGPAVNSQTGERIKRNEIGAILGFDHPAKIRETQQLALDSSPHRIPLIFGMDVIHGYKTIFPIPLGLSATWDMAAIEESACIAAVEASANGICWTFSPMVDIARDSRWGRIAEGAGEDPWLGSEIAKAYVRGYQGDLTKNTNIMACMKHYALYGASDAGKDYSIVDMSRQRMFNVYMPPFKAAVEAGVGSVMSAFNEVEGIPAGANKWLLTDVLRTDWGFDGFVVADWDAVREMTVHGIGDLQEVSARALKAGLDMDMGSNGMVGTLKKSYDEGKVTMEDIDAACRHILEAKYKLGLFDDPFKYCNEERASRDIMSPEHRAVARRIAAESFVLLKNSDEILPLAAKGRIAVVGPLADNRANMVGTWSVSADLNSPVSILEGIREAVKGKATVEYARGCNFSYDLALEQRASFFNKGFERDSRSDSQLHDEALNIARRSDVVVAVMGESAEMSGESSSRVNLDIPDAQKDLLRKLVATGKPVVLVLCTGRPLTLCWEQENVDAILNVWFPGTEAGHAVADVLFGKVNPGGKLTTTWPRHVGQEPLYYNYKNTGRPPRADGSIVKYTTGYIDETHLPLYPFGFGLSYTDFRYGTIHLDKAEMTDKEEIKVSVEVANVGKYEGQEVVQLYLRDVVGSVTRPLKELKGFRKICLQPGETQTVEFAIDADMLKFYDYDLNFVCEPGDFEVMVGGNSRDVQTAGFKLK